MSTGLMEQWSLSDAQICDAGSSDQAQKCKADFKLCMSPVSQCLQYTVTHAERCSHDGIVAKRDQVFPAYQAVIPKIDPDVLCRYVETTTRAKPKASTPQ